MADAKEVVLQAGYRTWQQGGLPGRQGNKGVWAEIVAGCYVAQEFAPPSERVIRLDGASQARKADVRLYVYDGQILISAARLYQGQATNFRTPGGGFAPVFAV